MITITKISRARLAQCYLMALAICALAVVAFSPAASAGFADPLSPGGGVRPFGEPLPPQLGPIPPPPGDGPTPEPVTPGDGGAPMPPPSGMADPTHGNNFPAGTGHSRTTVYIHSQGNGGSRGNRMVQTLRGDQLSAEQVGKVQSVLGVNLGSGEPSVDVNATPSQLAQLNDILAPYPQTGGGGGRKQVVADSPGQGYPKPGNENLYDFDGPLPTVRTFSRYLVILGVVSATVFMAFAATAVVLGHPYAGSRVIGTAAGLMLLLMGYTVWKVVQMNTFDANSPDNAQIRQRAGDARASDAFLNQPGGAQQGAGSVGRSGVPVEPLWNATIQP